jgi:hypothetical protein
MDPVIATVVVVAILAGVAIAAIIVFRDRLKLNLRGPGGANLDIDGAKHAPATKLGIKIGTAEAQGNIRTINQAGTGIEAETLRAVGDIETTLSQPENDRPKA